MLRNYDKVVLLMEGFFESIRAWVMSLTPAQIASLLVCVAALYVCRKVVKKGLSAALTVVAILAGLYFLVPGLYFELIGCIKSIF